MVTVVTPKPSWVPDPWKDIKEKITVSPKKPSGGFSGGGGGGSTNLVTTREGVKPESEVYPSTTNLVTTQEGVKPESEIKRMSTPEKPKSFVEKIGDIIKVPAKLQEGLYSELGEVGGKISKGITTSNLYASFEENIFGGGGGLGIIVPKEQRTFKTTQQKTVEYESSITDIEHQAKEEQFGIALTSSIWGEITSKGAQKVAQVGYEKELEGIYKQGKTSEEQARLFEQYEESTRLKWESQLPQIYSTSMEFNPFMREQKKKIETFELRYTTQLKQAEETFSPKGLKGSSEYSQILSGATVGVLTLPLTLPYTLTHPIEFVKGVVERPFQAAYQMIGTSLALGVLGKGYGYAKGKIASYTMKPSISYGETIQYTGNLVEGKISLSTQNIGIQTKVGGTIYKTAGERAGMQISIGESINAYSEFVGRTTKGTKPIAGTFLKESYPQIITTGESYYGSGSITGFTILKETPIIKTTPSSFNVAIAGIKEGSVWKSVDVLAGKQKGFGLQLTKEAYTLTAKSGVTKTLWETIGEGATKKTKFKLPESKFDFVNQAKFTGTFVESNKMIGDIYGRGSILKTTGLKQQTPSSVASLIKVHKSIISSEIAKASYLRASNILKPLSLTSSFGTKLKSTSKELTSFTSSSLGEMKASNFRVTPISKTALTQITITTPNQFQIQKQASLSLQKQLQFQEQGYNFPSPAIPSSISFPSITPPIIPFSIEPPRLYGGRKSLFKSFKMKTGYEPSLGGVLFKKFAIKAPKGINVGLMPVRPMIESSRKNKNIFGLSSKWGF